MKDKAGQVRVLFKDTFTTLRLFLINLLGSFHGFY